MFWFDLAIHLSWRPRLLVVGVLLQMRIGVSPPGVLLEGDSWTSWVSPGSPYECSTWWRPAFWCRGDSPFGCCKSPSQPHGIFAPGSVVAQISVFKQRNQQYEKYLVKALPWVKSKIPTKGGGGRGENAPWWQIHMYKLSLTAHSVSNQKLFGLYC